MAKAMNSQSARSATGLARSLAMPATIVPMLQNPTPARMSPLRPCAEADEDADACPAGAAGAAAGCGAGVGSAMLAPDVSRGGVFEPSGIESIATRPGARAD